MPYNLHDSLTQRKSITYHTVFVHKQIILILRVVNQNTPLAQIVAFIR